MVVVVVVAVTEEGVTSCNLLVLGAVMFEAVLLKKLTLLIWLLLLMLLRAFSRSVRSLLRPFAGPMVVLIVLLAEPLATVA